MGMQGANAPIIIKRKKVSGGDGHHGGAWKVAYADFVTAMMAFFMLMWLLNATTEQQRKGIADYFSPTLPINRISGGGDGMFGGDNIFAEQVLAQSGTGASHLVSGSKAVESDRGEDQAGAGAAVATLHQVEAVLLGQGGESALSEKALRHIITRLTDEGLIIELFDLEDESLFIPGTKDPNPILIEISTLMAGVFGLVKNDVAISAHTASRPVVVAEQRNWELSSDRAMAVRILLEEGSLDPERVQRVTGYADRKRVADNPMAPRNNRVEVTLLRSDL